MKYFLNEVIFDKTIKKNAGSKARQDAIFILQQLEYKELDIEMANWREMNKIKDHIYKYFILKKIIFRVNQGDTLFIQFALVNNTIFLKSILKNIREKNVKIYFLIHDIETIRGNIKFIEKKNLNSVILDKIFSTQAQEIELIKLADGIISHNEEMKKVLISYGIEEKKIVSLKIFGYLIPNWTESKLISKDLPIIVAGNLSNEKSVFLKFLPSNVTFNLYGVNYTEVNTSKNINYKGSFLPNELPNYLEGSFGLFWDGDSIETCSGNFGNYLKFNNPHKASLYLASGFPIIVWKESALAEFVLRNKCGLVIKSINELENLIHNLSDDEYELLVENTRKIGKLIRDGSYLKNANRSLK